LRLLAHWFGTTGAFDEKLSHRTRAGRRFAFCRAMIVPKSFARFFTRRRPGELCIDYPPSVSPA
jgi:hypothetical protein